MPSEEKFSLPKAIIEARKHYLEYENPFGAPKEERFHWVTDYDLPRRHETIFFASCMNPLMGYAESLLKYEKTLSKLGIGMDKMIALGKIAQKLKLDKIMSSIKSLNKEYGATLAHAIELLKEMGIEFGFLYEEEPCCGGGLHTYGFLEDFAERAKSVYQFLKDRGVKRIITINPVCGAIFKHYYPEYVEGFDIEVKHITEIIFEYMQKNDIRLKDSKERTVVFHDPCYLARYMNITEEPREILKRIDGLKLVEPVNNRLATKCDGGGGVEVVYPKLARRIAVDRYQELVDTGADLVVTACAPCVMMLRIGRDLLGRNEEIMDIVDVVYYAMKGQL
ncbi:MAG: (Fe-S)-binding protein [Candidatus Odinarchaeota archaeon]|nr:(Fe-S)-binding protein [Candidatus Odinarchaeota archaeon]